MKQQKIKKIVSLVLTIVMCSLLWLPASATEAQPRLEMNPILSVPIVGQGAGTSLCWAACGAAVVNYLKGSSETTTTFTTKSLGTYQDTAVYPAALYSYLTDEFDLSATLATSGSTLTSQLIASQIGAGKPMILLINTAPNGFVSTVNHYIVVYGCHYNDAYGYDNMTVYYMDPADSGSRISKSYSDLASNTSAYIYNLTA